MSWKFRWREFVSCFRQKIHFTQDCCKKPNHFKLTTFFSTFYKMGQPWQLILKIKVLFCCPLTWCSRRPVPWRCDTCPAKWLGQPTWHDITMNIRQPTWHDNDITMNIRQPTWHYITMNIRQPTLHYMTTIRKYFNIRQLAHYIWVLLNTPPLRFLIRLFGVWDTL